jgi:molybdopterin synthase catalytic subunit
MPGRPIEVRLSSEPFEPGALLTAFCRGRSETGAVVSFTGLARSERGAVAALELDAYPGFTEAAIAETAEAAADRFDLQDVLIVHRTGKVAPGEAIVFVAAAAAHRRAAFEGADFLMDYLKSRAPFWKKSHEAGGARWIEPTMRDYEDAARWDAPKAQP